MAKRLPPEMLATPSHQSIVRLTGGGVGLMTIRSSEGTDDSDERDETVEPAETLESSPVHRFSSARQI